MFQYAALVPSECVMPGMISPNSPRTGGKLSAGMRDVLSLLCACWYPFSLTLFSLLPVADQTFRKRLLPSWCSYLAHGISFFLFATSTGVSVWIGVGFSSSVALMWLISGIFSFLASFLVWEPLKVRKSKGLHKHVSVQVHVLAVISILSSY